MSPKFIILWVFQICATTALVTGDQWSDIVNTPTYLSIPQCAQKCVLEVNNAISCWSYGCVCSEHTLGNNYNTSISNIASCAAANCTSDGGNIAVASATNGFQQLCQNYVSEVISNVVSTTTVSGTSAPASVVVTVTTGQVVTSPPSAVPTFKAEQAIRVNLPTQAYQRLTPCLKFVFNGCMAPEDNSTNCNVVGCADPKNNATCRPSDTHDYTQKWLGLGVALKCALPECICSPSAFSYAFQQLFDEAQYVCDVSIPAVDLPSPDFESMGQMITEFCSGPGGSVLDNWLLRDVGYKKESGLSVDAKAGMYYGIPSLAVTVAALFWAVYIYKRRR